jgi:hypothetical protein
VKNPSRARGQCAAAAEPLLFRTCRQADIDEAVRRGEESPFLTLHREMNRLLDDVSRGFNLSPFGSDRFFDRIAGNLPRVEVSAPSMANSGTEAVRSRFAAFRGARTLRGVGICDELWVEPVMAPGHWSSP